MKLLRFAVAHFSTKSPIKSATSRIGDVDVTIAGPQGTDTKDQSFLLTAKLALGAVPQKDDASRIVVPTAERERCEFAIDAICDLFSTFYGCSRSILSPAPCIALECEDAEEREYLETSRGILAAYTRESGARNEIPMQADLLTSLSDRLLGVALLAEAYSGSESGRYREFVRFFELAFRRAFTELSKTLHRFFESTPYGYTRSEIDRWVALRHPLSHADLRKTPIIGVTSDVRRHILRMEQAALDVLFNKASWGDKSLTRRAVWIPDARTTSENGHIVVKQGTKLALIFRIYDEFDVYPRVLQVTLSNIEASWYVRINDDNAPHLQRDKGEPAS